MSDSNRLIDLLASTEKFFLRKGIESPRRNAEAIFAHALGVPRIELYVQHDRPVNDFELIALRELIRRRANREPLQYLLGKLDFAGVEIVPRPGLLIPRPETEELVVELSKHVPSGARILDIGAGTGCISVALAKSCVDCQVVAADIDPDAVESTSLNARRNEVAEHIASITADLFDDNFPAKCGAPFDVVVSNPPYIREAEWKSLQTEVKDFERKHALVSGSEGDECYVRIAQLLPGLLKSRGILALEFGHDQAGRIRRLFTSILTRFDIYHDMQGVERYLIGNY
ncbi:peptide chain release factor N(5)-glutamine methyltransferase [bacterium]|nr:peptide chain release factor N(5)-glutamine methyltransferase [bacterium]